MAGFSGMNDIINTDLLIKVVLYSREFSCGWGIKRTRREVRAMAESGAPGRETRTVPVWYHDLQAINEEYADE
eukprot:scaffold29030_cov24-Prasinocladus_malaysianus.AAC.1